MPDPRILAAYMHLETALRVALQRYRRRPSRGRAAYLREVVSWTNTAGDMIGQPAFDADLLLEIQP